MAGTHSLPGPKANMNVDYAIKYNIPDQAVAEAEAGFRQLIEALTKAGLASEVRPGRASSVLVFVKIASQDYLRSRIYQERVQDWLYGVRAKTPHQDVDRHFQQEPITEAERLRLGYLLMTKPKLEGGAGITPKSRQWTNVESIFPLHNHAFNNQWIKQWSSKYALSDQDISQIRNKFGEQVAFYFAFLQSYSTFLMFPAALGFGSWLILGRYSWLFGVAISLWSIVFFEYWKKKEVDLAVRWGVRGVGKIQLPRSEFEWDHEAPDPLTGEPVKVYSPVKRFQTQLLQMPFALVCLAILGALYLSCFAIEIFIRQIYSGPFQMILVFLPTIILTAFTPFLSSVLGNIAKRLTELENYETHDGHEAALTRKIFVINFVTSYTPLFLTAFLYAPFGKVLVPYLDFLKVTVEKLSSSEKSVAAQEFEIDPNRLKQQIIYFTVTAQVVNFALEVVLPFVQRKVFKAVEKVQHSNDKSPAASDVPEEAAFLSRVRNEAELGVYDVSGDYREMAVQFGYLTLFSVIWPLTPVSFLINNWVELRSDAVKICTNSQRPIPWRADSIGPWLNALGFLSWFGSLVSSAIIFLFSGGDSGPGGVPWNISGAGLLLTLLLSEHVYLGVQLAVRHVMGQMDSPGLQKERAERFSIRKQLLEESLGQDATEKSVVPDAPTGEKITREALEEEARRTSIRGQGTPEEAFWQRQRGMAETISMGRVYIEKIAAENQTAKS